jgi:hypothetical protein
LMVGGGLVDLSTTVVVGLMVGWVVCVCGGGGDSFSESYATISIPHIPRYAPRPEGSSPSSLNASKATCSESKYSSGGLGWWVEWERRGGEGRKGE